MDARGDKCNCVHACGDLDAVKKSVMPNGTKKLDFLLFSLQNLAHIHTMLDFIALPLPKPYHAEGTTLLMSSCWIVI